MKKWTKEELYIVCQWLTERQKYLNNERLRLECGDEFAFSTGKGNHIAELQHEADAISTSLLTIKDTMEN